MSAEWKGKITAEGCTGSSQCRELVGCHPLDPKNIKHGLSSLGYVPSSIPSQTDDLHAIMGKAHPVMPITVGSVRGFEEMPSPVRLKPFLNSSRFANVYGRGRFWGT